MFNVSEFIHENRCLVYSTFGIAVLGYLGFKCVAWMLIKVGLAAKVDAAAKEALQEDPKKPVELKEKWWTDITETDSYKIFKQDWRRLADHQTKETVARSFKKEYKSPEDYFGVVWNMPSNFSFWMKGVAFLASYMSAKKNIQGLYVLRHTEDLEVKMEEIIKNPADQRVAFIVGISRDYPFVPQHKIPVLVEKKGGQVTVAVLDSMPEAEYGNRDVTPVSFESQMVVKNYVVLNAKEVALRYIHKACRKHKTAARFLHSTQRRELHGGCAIFALQDACAFLKDPRFIDKLPVSKSTPFDGSYTIEEVDRLPAECLGGTQSLSALEKYKKEGADFDSTLIGRKRSLQGFLDEHAVTVESKPQNHYITKKIYVYMNLLMKSLKTFSKEEMDAICSRSLA